MKKHKTLPKVVNKKTKAKIVEPDIDVILSDEELENYSPYDFCEGQDLPVIEDNETYEPDDTVYPNE